MATLHTRLTRALELRHPVLSAPMAFAGVGTPAAAVSRAGGLGLIGGDYGDPTWLEDEFSAEAGDRVGVGLRKSPSLLTDVLKHRPAAVMQSFGDPRSFVDEIDAIEPAAAIVERMVDEAVHGLERHGGTTWSERGETKSCRRRGYGGATSAIQAPR